MSQRSSGDHGFLYGWHPARACVLAGARRRWPQRTAPGCSVRPADRTIAAYRAAPASPPRPRSPNMARFYDAMLAGKDNYAADRELARRITAVAPSMPRLFHLNRVFLAAAVRRMADRGVTQFIDLGCGLPTNENTHQIARRANPRAHVIYVDHDPTVLVHGHALLADNPETGVVDADIRRPEAVLEADRTLRLLDLTRPVGVLLTSLLPHVHDDDDPHGIVRAYMDPLPPGSMLALSHFHAPGSGRVYDDHARFAERLMLGGLGSGWFRTGPAIAAFFDGLALDDLGLRPLTSWIRRTRRPAPAMASLALCGLAGKP